MATAEDILRRMADDPKFALAMRTDPVTALRGIAISAAELRRIEEVLEGRSWSVNKCVTSLAVERHIYPPPQE